eukprot:366261-Chlamydomonas_euryale.AAC.6
MRRIRAKGLVVWPHCSTQTADKATFSRNYGFDWCQKPVVFLSQESGACLRHPFIAGLSIRAMKRTCSEHRLGRRMDDRCARPACSLSALPRWLRPTPFRGICALSSHPLHWINRQPDYNPSQLPLLRHRHQLPREVRGALAAGNHLLCMGAGLLTTKVCKSARLCQTAWMDAKVDGWMDEWNDGRMDGRMVNWMDVWTDGWVDR